MWSVEQVMGAFVGPPIAGTLIAFAVPAPFTVNALAFALAAWLVWLIAMPPRLLPVRRRISVEIMEGWRWLRAHPMLLRLAFMLGPMNFLSTMTLTVLILYSQEILHLGAVEHGTLLTAGAVGGVVGGILGPRLIARLGPLPTIYLSLILMMIPFILLAFTSSVPVTALALFLEMLGSLLWNIVTVSYRQRLIPEHLLGRVNALYRCLAWGPMPFGALAGGWIVALSEPNMGREMALRMPFILAIAGSAAMLIYGRFKVRL
jgi:MFS family permease